MVSSSFQKFANSIVYILAIIACFYDLQTLDCLHILYFCLPFQNKLILQNKILEDTEIIHAIRKGGKPKRDAASSLFISHQGMMHTIRTKFNLSSEDIKDAYADAVSIVIWNVSTKKFQGQSKLSTYLYRILYNKSVDLLRLSSTNKREPVEELSVDLSDDEVNDNIRVLETKLDVEKVKTEITTLGQPCSGILIDWGYWGYSMKEIAERNSLENADKAKKQKYSCLQKLRTILHAKGIK